MTSQWGEDPSKWVIQKSKFGTGWFVSPPHDGDAWIYPSFGAALAAVRFLIREHLAPGLRQGLISGEQAEDQTRCYR